MMNAEDVGKVLAVAAMYDRRKVGQADILAWADALDGLDPKECANAIRAHYTDPASVDAYLMPGHVIGRIQRVRAEHARQRRDEATLRGIAAATEQHDRERSHAAYLEARRSFAEALERKHGNSDSEAVS